MEALERLDEVPGIEVERVSNLYETEPVGYVDQPMFLNMAAAVSTSLSPHELLAVMQQIEKQLGRVRHIHWGPRTVDLDLLWMEGRRLDTPDLVLPHPRMQERAFVLRPLADIVPELEPSGLYPVVKTAREPGRKGRNSALENKQLAQRIRAFRKLKGLTQQELAERSGISLAVLGAIERETAVPRSRCWLRLPTCWKLRCRNLRNGARLSIVKAIQVYF